MLLSLLTQNKPQRVRFTSNDDQNAQDLFLVDVTLNDEYEKSSEITDSPVEDGTDITDHARLKPITYKIDGEISETPITLSASLQGLVTAAGANVGRELGGFGTTIGGAAGGLIGAKLFQSSQNPAKVARDKLEELIDKKIIFTIIVKNKRLKNMMLTSLRFPRSQGDTRKLRFSATAKEVKIVQAQTVLIKNIARSASNSAASKQRLGNQPTTSPTSSEEAGSSVLYKGLKFFGG